MKLHRNSLKVEYCRWHNGIDRHLIAQRKQLISAQDDTGKHNNGSRKKLKTMSHFDFPSFTKKTHHWDTYNVIAIKNVLVFCNIGTRSQYWIMHRFSLLCSNEAYAPSQSNDRQTESDAWKPDRGRITSKSYYFASILSVYVTPSFTSISITSQLCLWYLHCLFLLGTNYSGASLNEPDYSLSVVWQWMACTATCRASHFGHFVFDNALHLARCAHIGSYMSTPG